MRKALTICAVLCAMAAMTACKNGSSRPQPAEDSSAATADTAKYSSGGMMITVGVSLFSEILKFEDLLLIDVRTPEEYAEGHIEGAVNIDIKADDFDERTKDLTGDVAVYCRGGKRSYDAAFRLAMQGCVVYDLDGGIRAWEEKGMPVVR